MKITTIASSLLLLGSAIATPLYVPGITQRSEAPLISSMTADPHVINDSYIVVFKDHLEPHHCQSHHEWISSVATVNLQKRGLWEKFDHLLNEGIKHTYFFDGLKGYSGVFSQSTLEEIRKSPDVAYVEKDSMVYANDLQRMAPWGLARISHRDSLKFSTFNKYLYDGRGGDGVTAYVIDTGVNYEHVDFEKRASWGKTMPQNDVDEDRNGHGTHVAGTIAGKNWGVAKKANVVAVKVLGSNGSGTMSDVVKGVEWAVENNLSLAAAAKKNGKKHKGAVANMSLGGGRSRALESAVNGAVTAGVSFAVAAGNENQDACNVSPSAAELAVTVGASTLADERASFSNHGKCVDVFAPGLDIESTWIGSKVATNTISGTSMASPHVAGLLAYFLSLQPDSDSDFATGPINPKKLKQMILDMATKNALVDELPVDTPNLLIFNDAPKA